MAKKPTCEELEQWIWGREILTRRGRIKKNTMLQRRRYNCSLRVA